MTSIRRTLLLNMLLLLVVTLGVVSYFVYRTAEGALRQRHNTARELVEVRYADRQDDLLRNRADELAGEVQSNFNRDEFRKQWMASEFYAVIPQVIQSFALGHGPHHDSRDGRIAFEHNARLATELRLNEEDLYREPATALHEYLQISGESRHILDFPLAWGHQPRPTRAGSGLALHFDTLHLPDGTTVRRVVVKAPVTRYSRVEAFAATAAVQQRTRFTNCRSWACSAARSSDRRFGGLPPAGPIFGPPPPPSNPADYSLPSFYIHCAGTHSPDNPVS